MVTLDGRSAPTKTDERPDAQIEETVRAGSTVDAHDVADLELDGVDDLGRGGGDVHLHGVAGLDVRVGVAEGAAIMGGDVGDALVADLLGLNFAELELRRVEMSRASLGCVAWS